MTKILQMVRFVLMALLVTTGLSACVGSGGGTGPTPLPSPSSTPPVRQPELLIERPFEASPDIYGFIAVSPKVSVASGTLIFEATWTPQPSEGQMYLFLLPWEDSGTSTSPEVLNACFFDPMCSQALARDVSSGHPKRIEYRKPAGMERVKFWVRGTRGQISGTIKIWFLPDR